MADTTTMDFFRSQDAARRKTAILVAYYILAVILIILAVYFVFSLFFVFGTRAAETSEEGIPEAGLSVADFWDSALFLWVVAGTVLIVTSGTLYKIRQLASGGEVVAQMLGGRPVSQSTTDPDERKILNVVAEMSIASGTPVPRVFIMDHEQSINAFAAGFTPGSAVIGVTRGCVQQLTRDELQGVVAHEFSHILNGDMRLNIKLIGVLHGILIIGIVGYWVMRAGFHSGGRKKGAALGIALFGLLVMIIGYVGVFFGKLIKSAVSRQREYLADASAVQFTRNPDGIGGALSKIAGLTTGSRIRSTHAEEASHFFFSNALAKSFMNMMATHPPLEERIRRIDPRIQAEPRKATRSAPTRPAIVPAAAAVSGFAGTPAAGAPARFEVDPRQVTAQVGSPRAEHIAYSASLLAGMPDALTQSAREPFGARAVVYCLLLNRDADARGRQMTQLRQHADPAVFAETGKLAPLAGSIGPDARLPLVDLAIPALKELSPDQYAAFQQNVACLVAADREIDLFEYALQRIITRHLDPIFGKSKLTPLKYRTMEPAIPHCVDLLSCLAYWGADEMENASAAFSRAAEILRPGFPLRIAPVADCGLSKLDTALDHLVMATPMIKKKVIAACAACISADNRITHEEAELLRAVADSLGCPIPPFLPAKAA